MPNTNISFRAFASHGQPIPDGIYALLTRAVAAPPASGYLRSLMEDAQRDACKERIARCGIGHYREGGFFRKITVIGIEKSEGWDQALELAGTQNFILE